MAYWTDGRQTKILTVTPGYELIALDAKTGHPDVAFGSKGVVDLTEQVEKDANFNPAIGHLMNTSPPLVFGNVAIIPTSLENARNPKSMKFPKADMMAFDVRTGKKLWSFHTIPRKGEFGEDTWLNGSNIYTGHTGAWAPFTVDEQLGYVYIPVEGATGDQYGGQRPGNNLFSSSIVCLDIKTGKRIWHYQLTHHDIWDYDMPTAPILADITVNGKPIKAVVQLTKQAFAFVFDRTNGQPVWPIEERPVPQSDAPGEKTSPTQPFPTKPAAVDRQGMSENDLIDFTPQLKQMALDAIKGYRLGPMYTPPSVVDAAKGTKGTLTFPGSGGVDWEGGALDPETGFLYVGSATRTRHRRIRIGKAQAGRDRYPDDRHGQRGADDPAVADRETAMDPNHRHQPQYGRYALAGPERWHAGVGEESSAAQRRDASADRKCRARAAADGDQDAAVCGVRLRDGSRVPRLRQEDGRAHLGDDDAAGPADRRTDDVSVQRQAVRRRGGRGQSCVTRTATQLVAFALPDANPKPAAGEEK